MKADKKYILSMQPELIIEEELEDKDVEEEFEEVKLQPDSEDRGDSYQDREVSIEEIDASEPMKKPDGLQRSLSLNTESAT